MTSLGQQLIDKDQNQNLLLVSLFYSILGSSLQNLETATITSLSLNKQ